MPIKNKILIYGAYGYTGQLIIEQALQQNLSLLLAGRNEQKLKSTAEKYNLEYQVFSLNDTEKLELALSDAAIVIHAAGPFIHTVKEMVTACLNTKTHYLDITGEYQVFEYCATQSEAAKSAGIMLMPGTGFDVVPSDCLANYLKQKLPSALILKLAFAGQNTGFSRGTAKTMVEGLGYGGMVRMDHKLISVPNAFKSEIIDFGSFKTLAVTIPWGDLSTAYHSTGIPNIEVYMGVNEKLLKQMKRSNYLAWLFRQSWVKNFLKAQIDKRKPGPNEQQRLAGKSFFWGSVTDNAGNLRSAILQTPEGYTLTAITSVLIANKILQNNFTPGFQTPASAYGYRLIQELPSCQIKDAKHL